ncbi:MAG: D-alanine--D-alanine ligase family protein [Deinococcaceae bacterium]
MTTRKTRVLLLAGGKSGEHEISLSSARSVLRALSENQFEVTPILISKEGKWLSIQDSQHALLNQTSIDTGGDWLAPAPTRNTFDVVFPILHGPNGEDGTLQGFLKLIDLPFVGSDVLGSAVCMDKVLSKQLFSAVGIPQVEYRLWTRQDQKDRSEHAFALAEQLKYPLFVKPSNMGSSVGICKVKSEHELNAALEYALSFDRRVILEAMTAEKPRELEIGILGNDRPKTSAIGELTFDAEFYDYETKYTEGRAQMHIPADIPETVAEKIRGYALEAFKTADCAGLARIDFFYVPSTGEIFLNEVNTMPGFTATSMYPKLWEASGLDYGALIAALVDFALESR